MEILKLKTDYIKLGQALKASGLCDSGADAKHVIENGSVKVNGAVEIQRGKKLHHNDIITYGEKDIRIISDAEG